MKRILIVCLLGMGLLLPATKSTAKEFSRKEISKRIVDVMIEGDVIELTSDAGSGTLVNCKIWDMGKHLVLQQYVSGYADAVDVSDLTAGWYSVQVFTTGTTYSENVYVS